MATATATAIPLAMELDRPHLQKIAALQAQLTRHLSTSNAAISTRAPSVVVAEADQGGQREEAQMQAQGLAGTAIPAPSLRRPTPPRP